MIPNSLTSFSAYLPDAASLHRNAGSACEPDSGPAIKPPVQVERENFLSDVKIHAITPLAEAGPLVDMMAIARQLAAVGLVVLDKPLLATLSSGLLARR